ncbi:nuclear transport factor 2 family protein [Pseudomonas sp. MPFS]|uniref:YybH family protein n=1 Tax=Pseudomonas sp. MPFS TaxID=2795724 RepID=UPI001F129442|nr:nuclear transport factor 2 family protein [Pseudomonas sp. MPFS]UMZ10493.1 nuclear transport factor 2 family protein [Pseudomonas sp. MPFS]
MSNPSSEARVRSLIDHWRQAVMARDIEQIVSFYADDIVSFDAVGALQFKGKEAYRAHWQACMQVCPGPGIFEFHQLHVQASDELAFAHWLAHCGGTDADGVSKTCWMRVSAAYQCLGGQWQVVHEHWSAPFDMQTGTTLFDLEP